MDALYALADTYLHFPQDYLRKRGKGLGHIKKEKNEMTSSRLQGESRYADNENQISEPGGIKYDDEAIKLCFSHHC